MGKRKFEELKYRLCDELQELEERPRWSEKDVEMIDRLTHSIKSLMKYLEMEEQNDLDYEGQSFARGRYNTRYYRDDQSYGRGRSYDGSYDDRGYNNYRSYDDRPYMGRSRDDEMDSRKQELEHELEALMEKTSDADVKEAIKKTMAQMKKNK